VENDPIELDTTAYINLIYSNQKDNFFLIIYQENDPIVRREVIRVGKTLKQYCNQLKIDLNVYML